MYTHCQCPITGWCPFLSAMRKLVWLCGLCVLVAAVAFFADGLVSEKVTHHRWRVVALNVITWHIHIVVSPET